MFRTWLKRRREEQALVHADVDAMIERYGYGANGEARRRFLAEFDNTTIDGNRASGHWVRVGAQVDRRLRNWPAGTA